MTFETCPRENCNETLGHVPGIGPACPVHADNLDGTVWEVTDWTSHCDQCHSELVSDSFILRRGKDWFVYFCCWGCVHDYIAQNITQSCVPLAVNKE